jgi:hypothetical protein
LLYEHGMVEVTQTPDAGQGRLRLVRWSEVAEAAPDAARPGSYALTIAATAGEPASPVRLADLSPAAKLRSSLARHLPHVPWPIGRPRGHGRVALTALGFAALAILPALGPVVRTATSRQTAETTAETVVWPTPSTAASRIGSPTAAAPLAAPAASSPAVRIRPVPSTTEGFYEACKGTVMFPNARPFSGPPPHLLYFPVPSLGDESWRATKPSDVQLIVCTKGAPNPAPRCATAPTRPATAHSRSS